MYHILMPENDAYGGNGRGLLARGQTTVLGVPPAILPKLQSLKYRTGIPISWLAAVCERTQWNPNYSTINYRTDGGHVGTTQRQAGLAGIWRDVPEIPVPVCQNAGWTPFQYYANINGYGRCWGCCGTDTNDYLDIDQNLALAARILGKCQEASMAYCGELSNLLFLWWQWGGNWKPQIDINGKCVAPTNIPDIFLTEIDTLLTIQALYADIFMEPPVRVIPGGPLAVALTANTATPAVDEQMIAAATATGGQPPYTKYHWEPGDGTMADTTTPTASFGYSQAGSYSLKVTVTDSAANTASSPPLPILVGGGPGPGGGTSPWLWAGLLGLAGLLGILGLAGAGKGGGAEGKLADAARMRRDAQDFRTRAAQLRGQGNVTDAADLERRAMDRENEALRVEQEAAREQAERYASESYR